MRPICPVCNQHFLAINYYKDGQPHYRSRCEKCARRDKKLKPQEPKWKTKGYKKKAACDRCGFRARFLSQLLVYHIDGNMKNVELPNLRTICLNCVEEVKRLDVPWVPNSLQADR